MSVVKFGPELWRDLGRGVSGKLTHFLGRSCSDHHTTNGRMAQREANGGRREPNLMRRTARLQCPCPAELRRGRRPVVVFRVIGGIGEYPGVEHAGGDDI